MKKILVLFIVLIQISAYSQNLRWSIDGNSYYQIELGEINRHVLPSNTKTTFVSKSDLTPPGQSKSLSVRNYSFSEDQTKLLIFNNTRKVWRLDTRGDYWVFDLKSKSLKQIGKSIL